jgi:hypothetical protein
MNFRLWTAMMLPKRWVSQRVRLHGSKLTAMAKKAKQGKKGKKGKKEKMVLPTEGLWIAPRNSPKAPTGESGRENRPDDAPINNRFLELADVALGLKQSILKKR